jgi:4-amino-4-deoxy-L-arabinose transferase-like glycosyltransferase
MAENRLSAYILALAWFSWAIFILAGYYTQILKLGSTDLSQWFNANYSLGSLRDLWSIVNDLLRTRSWPATGEAAYRALSAVFGAVAVLCSAHVLGRGLLSALYLGTTSANERFVYTVASGLGCLSLLLLGLCAAGLYTVKVVGSILVTGFLVWLALMMIAWVSKMGSSEAPAETVSATPKPLEDLIGKALFILCSAVALICALAPEIEYDALWYHIGLPKLWLNQGRLVDLPFEYVSLYPMAWELLFGAAMSLGGPVGAKLLHFSCMLLTAALVYQICRRYFPQRSAWLAVAFFTTIPTVIWQASTAYIDLGLSLYLGLALYALLRYLDHANNAWLFMAGLQLGLALATKHLAMFGAVILIGGLYFILWQRGSKPTRAWMPPAAVGIVSLIPALPWYLRSWWATANPVFPFFFNLFGAPPHRWDHVTQNGLNQFLDRFGPADNLVQMLTIPYDLTVHASRYGGALGPVFLLLLPVLLFVRRPNCWTTAALACFTVFYFALWASPVSSFQMRFLIPITPVAAVLAVEAYSRLILHLPQLLVRTRAATALITLVILLNLPPFTSLHENQRVNWDGWLTHVIHRIPFDVVLGKVSQEQYLSRKVPSFNAWRYINNYLPADAVILTFSGGDHFYSERSRIWANATIARPVVWQNQHDVQENLLYARRYAITHILADKKNMQPGKDYIRILDPILVRNFYENIYEDKHFIVYRIL